MKTTSLQAMPTPNNSITQADKSLVNTVNNSFTETRSLPPEEKKPIAEFQKELLEKYNSDVVKNVFKHISKYALTTLPLSEVNRIEVFCNYFDMEGKIVKELRAEDKAVARIFKRYLFHTREEVSARLNEGYKGEALTHDNIQQTKEHFNQIYQMIPALLQRYNESICHRALNHFSILSSETLCGRDDLSSFEQLCIRVDDIFAKEQEVTALLNKMPFPDLQKHFDTLQRQIKNLKDPYAKFDLEQELIIKCGRTKMLLPFIPKSHIEERAKLFSASFEGTKWANDEEELTPLDHSIHKNINNVFFLKDSITDVDGKSVAVFKTQTNGKAVSGAMEALAYDVSLIFGVNSGLVPTKQKKLKGMSGSIQIFQNGLSWPEFSLKSPEEQEAIINGISMRSFLEALLPILVLGNRDVHMDNFFFVKKDPVENEVSTTPDDSPSKSIPQNQGASSLVEHGSEKVSIEQKHFLSLPLSMEESLSKEIAPTRENSLAKDVSSDEYGIVLFDNEFCFQYSNYILTSMKRIKVPKVEKETGSAQVKLEEKPRTVPTKNPTEEKSEVVKEALSVPLPTHKSSGKSIPATEESEEVLVRESILPIRCAIMALPQADTPISKEDKAWLQRLVATWPRSFEDFFAYLNSPPGKEKLKHLPYKSLDRYQLKAFNERLQKLINIVNSKEAFTPRDLLIRLFPLYPAFYSLTELLYPENTEFAVGAKTIEYLCKKAVKLGKISQEKADHLLSEVYKCAEK